MTGWRLGCAVGPADGRRPIAKLNTNDESCTTHFVQCAGVEALRGHAAEPVANARHAARTPRCRSAGCHCDPRYQSPHRKRRSTCSPTSPRRWRRWVRRGRRLRRAGAAPHRRVVLHPAALRPAPAGRGPGSTCASPTPASRSTTSSEGLGLLAEWVSQREQRSPSPGRIPEDAVDCSEAEHEVDAWSADRSIGRDELLSPRGRRRRAGDVAHRTGRRRTARRGRTAAPGRRQRRGRLQQHRRAGVRRRGVDRHQHAGRAHRRDRRHRDGADPDGDPAASARASESSAPAPVAVGHVLPCSAPGSRAAGSASSAWAQIGAALARRAQGLRDDRRSTNRSRAVAESRRRARRPPA